MLTPDKHDIGVKKMPAHHGAVSQNLPCHKVLASLPCNCLLTKCHAAKVLPPQIIDANCHANLCWQDSHGWCQAPCSNMDAATELCNSHWPAPAQITPPALWKCDKMLLPETTVPFCQRSVMRNSHGKPPAPSCHRSVMGQMSLSYPDNCK